MFDKKGDKALSNQDLPHNFVISYIYELPIGKNKRFLSGGGALKNVAVSGWSVSGVQRYLSGQPLSFGTATGVPAFANSIRFNRVQGQSLSSAPWLSGHFNPITDPVFNAAAFSDPNSAANVAMRGTYAFGDLPRVTSEVRMTPYLSEDFNLLKRTYVGESANFLLQVSFLNAFNRHIWNRPVDLNPLDTGFSLIQYQNFSTTGGGAYLIQPRKIQLQLKFEF